MPRAVKQHSKFGAGKYSTGTVAVDDVDLFPSFASSKLSQKNDAAFRTSKFGTKDLLRSIDNESNLSRDREFNARGRRKKSPNLSFVRDMPSQFKLQVVGLCVATLTMIYLGSSSLRKVSDDYFQSSSSVLREYNDNGPLLETGNQNTKSLMLMPESRLYSEIHQRVDDVGNVLEKREDAAVGLTGIFPRNVQSNLDANMYYNLNPLDNSKYSPMPLPTEFYPQGGPAIAILVTNSTKDIYELQIALRSLAFLKGDHDPMHKAPILCFNEGDLNSVQLQQLIDCTDRPIAFPRVDFTSFPSGFNPDREQTRFTVKGRKAWGYYQMIRFWITGIWKHPAIAQFETIMRMDSDSCFKEENNYLPRLIRDDIYYHSQYVGFESGAEYVNGLYDFAIKFMRGHLSNHIIPNEPRNFLLWHFTTTVWTTMDTLPLFRTNFEVSRKSFMQRADVALWHEALTEQEPYGVFRHRWGDAVTRFLTASIFENQDRIMTIRPTGYFHKVGCSEDEVQEALSKLVA